MVQGETALTVLMSHIKREDLREGGRKRGKEPLSFLIYVSLYRINLLMLTNPNCPVVTKRRACEEHHGLSRAEIPLRGLLGTAMI